MIFEDLPQLKVGTGWLALRVIEGPGVMLTGLGWAPVLKVQELETSQEYAFFFGARSLGKPMADLRARNGNTWVDAKFRVRKQKPDKTAPYELRPGLG